ncbi:MAG: sodium:calcium antiporter [Mariprofundaceae bacterium]|nr:sodium:calcium antiporter [Mariprofundaceae bacterium]
MDIILSLLFALFVVFIAAQMFTNALEYMGERMGLSEGVTGSIFAAIGTAMPETIVPIVAIVAGGAAEHINHAVGMGAILGAPFMLGTLSLCLMALFAGMKHGWDHQFTPEPSGLKRDLTVFGGAFSLVIIAGLLPTDWSWVHLLCAIILLVTYCLYLLITIRASSALVADGHGTEADDPLYLGRIMGDSNIIASLQLLFALVILILGAQLFVHGIEQGAAILSISALVLSLLIVPVATELPEKVNSIIWVRRKRDTLAFGNITGAMVFQGTVIPAIGMMIMPWHFSEVYAIAAAALAVVGALWLWFLHQTSRLNAVMLLGNGLLYALFIALVIFLV